jgi:hypothetical protein
MEWWSKREKKIQYFGAVWWPEIFSSISVCRNNGVEWTFYLKVYVNL